MHGLQVGAGRFGLGATAGAQGFGEAFGPGEQVGIGRQDQQLLAEAVLDEVDEFGPAGLGHVEVGAEIEQGDLVAHGLARAFVADEAEGGIALVGTGQGRVWTRRMKIVFRA